MTEGLRQTSIEGDTVKLQGYHSPELTELGPMHFLLLSSSANNNGDVCSCFSGS